ncbi:hypothetical protein ASG32_27250 [Methylobacterium sp. Leaf361]|uniref:hypothetical protein n=1 Tax=Methylobacterium sp. Leaf361 TaxID=1736352 RepID=UPI0007015376|nr:hypothetical protein [Methylobacterium sp. Leaf361]KQS75463.1 hypothetical protein ASG32_27250 [Methylobacterium sp. Leaf361]
MKLSEMKVNSSAIEDGAWIRDIPEMGSLALKVRGIQNAAYRQLQNKLIEAIPRAKKPGGRIAPDEMDRVTNECLAATVLLDWSGLEDDDGEPLLFTRETAMELLSNPELRRFREAAIYAASMVGDQIASAAPTAPAA